ncbi:MAG: sulfite exporter TauE/SafE family protein [Alphaproteobacteria bacterium]|nr:MAG: sulfite exporter TauE/SafE family protein [Alphaproteobacteria bacterium]
MSLTELSLFAGAFLFTSTFSAAAGAGGGILMIAILSGFIPAAMLIPVQNAILLVNSSVRAGIYRQHINWVIAWPFIIGLGIGSFIGAFIYVQLPEKLISLFMGIAMLAFTWMPGKNSLLTNSVPLRVAMGAFHGFLSSLIGIGGLLQASFTKMGLAKNARIATFATVISFNNVWRGLAFMFLGVSLANYWQLIAMAIPLAFMGGWLGKRISDKIPESVFDYIFKTIVTLFALRLLYKAVF